MPDLTSSYDVLASIGLPLIEGIPSLSDLIPGFTFTQTTGDSAYDWPLLGLGPLLGLSGSTTFSNTFAQVPSLTGPRWPSEILDGLDIPAIGFPPGIPVVGRSCEAAVDLLFSASRCNQDTVGDRLDPRRAG